MKRCSLLSAVLLLLAVAAGAHDIVLRAGSYMGRHGRVVEDPVLVISGGQVTALRSGGAAPAGIPARTWPEGTVLTPGLVDGHAVVGLTDEADESAVAITPDVRAADAFRMSPEERRAVLGAGITRFFVAPGEKNLVGGEVALVRAVADDAGGWEIRTPAGLALSLTAGSRLPNRAPTSLAGQVRALRNALDSGELGSLDGRWIWARVGEPEEVLAATDVLGMGRPDRLILAGHVEQPALISELGRRVVVVSGPLSTGSTLAQLRAPARLHASGVAFAFGTGAAGPQQLRMQALQAVRHGLDRDAAWDALTGGWMESRTAEFVVWSGDPLDGGSRVLAVCVGGHILYEVEP